MHRKRAKDSAQKKRGTYNLQFKVILQMELRKGNTESLQDENNTINKGCWITKHVE